MNVYVILGLFFFNSIFAMDEIIPTRTGQSLINVVSEFKRKDAKKNINWRFFVSYEDIVTYYREVQPLLIPTSFSRVITKDLKEMKKKSSDLLFLVDLHKMDITPRLREQPLYQKSILDPDFNQSIFSFDVNGFMKQQGESSFVEAKNRYYKERVFNVKKQKYEYEYLHLNDWKSLFFPPIKSMKAKGEQYYFKHDNKVDFKSRILTEEFNTKLDKLTDSELSIGNRIKLLPNKDAYEEKMKLVQNAKKSILVAVMSIASDESSLKLVDALVKKSKEGVDVKVIMERLWTKLAFKKTLRKMTDGGVQVALADDMKLFKKKKEKGLFHNKFWVFDEKVGIVGGQNVVNSANRASGYNHWNKDIDTRIDGPLVADLMLNFALLWKRYDKRKKREHYNRNVGTEITYYEDKALEKRTEQKKNLKRGQSNYSNWFSDKNSSMNGVCRFVIQGPQNDINRLSKAYLALFQQAEKHIFLSSQHIEYELNKYIKTSWETKIFQGLYDLVKKDVRVDLLTNGIDGGFAEIGQNVAEGKKSQKKLEKVERKFKKQYEDGKRPGTFLSRISNMLGLMATKKYKPYLLEFIDRPNFHAWMSTQYLHSKTALIDNIMASVGSFNFEGYSAEKSHESAIFCYDHALVKQLRTDNILDIVNSTPVLK